MGERGKGGRSTKKSEGGELGFLDNHDPSSQKCKPAKGWGGPWMTWYILQIVVLLGRREAVDRLPLRFRSDHRVLFLYLLSPNYTGDSK